MVSWNGDGLLEWLQGQVGVGELGNAGYGVRVGKVCVNVGRYRRCELDAS